ncbi:MAG: CPBP family intramembrane metalloprotease [Pseudomonadota bacterium]|nr:CPBP family intramembrane metalloprotease [Pseudomonadota bacterium]
MIAATLLGLVLVLVLPAYALRPRGPDAVKRSLSTRLAVTTGEIAALVAALALIAPAVGLSFADLGLGWPLPRAGQIGMAIALLLVGALSATVMLMKPGQSPREQTALAELPRGRRETALYLLFALAAGVGWEILYRDFLLWWLQPMIGLLGAIAAASVAYGLAHGWKSRAEGLGSIVSAFVFTVAFVETGSLWWLIAIHTALPLVALLAGWRVRTRKIEALPA